MSPVRLVPGDGDGPEKARGASPPDAARGHDDEEDEGSRRATNIGLAVAVVAVVAIGIWLVDSLLEQRRIDECMARGQRNCGRLTTPAN